MYSDGAVYLQCILMKVSCRFGNPLIIVSFQIQKYDSMGGQASFTALDYMSPTPEWAVLGHSQRGFDPDETRWHRKKNKEMGGC